MKNFLLIVLLIFSVHVSNALSITDLSVSPIDGTNDINVNLKTYHTSGHYYFSHSYSVVNNIITLRVCYKRDFADWITYDNRNFSLSDLNIDTANYTLVVNLYYATLTSTPNVYECTSNIIRATATLNFETVLSNTVTLNKDSFESKEDNFILHPNPNKGKFNISNLQDVNIEIFDVFGQLVFTKKNVQNEIEMDLKKGIYFVKITSENGKTATKKIIVE